MTTPRQRDALYTCRPKHNAEFLRCPGSVSDAPSTYSLFQQTDSTTSYPQKSLCAFSTHIDTHSSPRVRRLAEYSHFDFTKSASHQRLACLLACLLAPKCHKQRFCLAEGSKHEIKQNFDIYIYIQKEISEPGKLHHQRG